MNTLNIKVRGNSAPIDMLADGKPLPIEKDKSGNRVYHLDTARDTVEVRIVEYLPIRGKFWFLRELFFFLVGLFGIFSFRGNRKSIACDCLFEIPLAGTTEVLFRMNRKRKSGKAVEVKSDAHVTEHANEFFVDKIARRRSRVCGWLAAIFWVGLIVATIIFLVKRFF